MLKIKITVNHYYQDVHNPHEQVIYHGGDGPSLLWLFRALIDMHKDFKVEIA